MTLQETIIDQLGVKPNIDPKEEIRKSVDFLKAYMLKHPFLKSYVLGISGGQDSTLAGRLANLPLKSFVQRQGKTISLLPFACLMECRRTRMMPNVPLLLSNQM